MRWWNGAVEVSQQGDGSWAAYLGPSDWDDERVAYEGDLIAQEAAEDLFYVLAHSGRRYGEL